MTHGKLRQKLLQTLTPSHLIVMLHSAHISWRNFLVVLAALAPKSEASRVALAGSLFGQGRKAIIFQNQYRIQASFADHLVGFHFASKHGLLGA